MGHLLLHVLRMKVCGIGMVVGMRVAVVVDFLWPTSPSRVVQRVGRAGPAP